MSNYEQQDLFQTPKESTSLLAPTLVSRFPLQARKGAKKIQDTSGQKYIDLLEMTGFVQCTFLEKTLVDILDKVSTPYQRTWSVVVTDGGVLVSKHRVSAQTTEDKESGGSQKIWPTPTQDIVRERKEKYAQGGKPLTMAVQEEEQKMWPTPRANNGNENYKTANKRMEKRKKEGRVTGGVRNLATEVQMWPTPRTRDYKGGSGTVKEKDGKYYRQSHTTGAKFGVTLDALVEYQEKQKMWPTPIVGDAHLSSKPEVAIKRIKEGKITLSRAVQSKMWPTPTANEEAAGTSKGKMQKMLGNHPKVRSQGIGTLNPTWVEWLMGFPIGYTDLKPSETQ